MVLNIKQYGQQHSLSNNTMNKIALFKFYHQSFYIFIHLKNYPTIFIHYIGQFPNQIEILYKSSIKFLSVLISNINTNLINTSNLTMGQAVIQYRLKQLDNAYTKYPNMVKILQGKQEIDFSQVKDKCNMIGQGCAGKVYLYKELGVVLKIMKKPDYERIFQEIILLDRVNAIWPDMFLYLVFENSKLVGFSMKFFDGKKIWEAYNQSGNILNASPSARVRLVKRLKQVVKRLQQLKVGHGDLHIDNILIKQSDKKKEQYDILIIDYGLGFNIDDYTHQKPSLTGWAFMKPHQAKTNYFYDTKGLNPYRLGRVALQILLLQTYDDYSHKRDEQPSFELKQISQIGFDDSVIRQIELLLHPDLIVRHKTLLAPSAMIQDLKMSKSIGSDYKLNSNGLSIISPVANKSQLKINKAQYQESYYVKHPTQLGYKN